MQSIHSQKSAPNTTNKNMVASISSIQTPSNDPACLACGTGFKRTRKDKKYCSKQCARKSTRNASRGSRRAEYQAALEHSFERTSWLAHDFARMPPDEQRRKILELLEAASGADTELRRILTDPKLLGAKRGDPIGKMFPDCNDRSALNIAKLVNRFCQQEWGCSIRAAIFDNGKPANRKFIEDPSCSAKAKVPPYIYGRPERTP